MTDYENFFKTLAGYAPCKVHTLTVTGCTKLPQWQSGVVSPDADTFLGKLADVLPSYLLSSAVGAYIRPVLATSRPKMASRSEYPPVTFLLLALSSAACSRSPMPVAARTLPQAELLHRAIASHVGRLSGIANEQASQELLGQNGHGHQHVHILPLGLLKQDNHLDHILLWAPGGFGDASQKIVRKLRATYMKGGVGELSLHFVGAGEAEDFSGFAYLWPILATATIWQSITPMVLPRFRKKNGKNTIEGQIAAELASRGLPAAKVDILEAESKAMRHYVRSRWRRARRCRCS